MFRVTSAAILGVTLLDFLKTNPALCTGCEACASKCPQQCIGMTADDEGFLYPAIDTLRCTDCGACDAACQVIHPLDSGTHPPHQVKAAWALDAEIRAGSSSGGLFSVLADIIFSRGGHVFGASFDAELELRHQAARSVTELGPLRGSKYIQSRIGATFQQVRSLLRRSEWVLFAGTPCQVAGLRRYLAKPYATLIAIDLVCHGVPSPKVFRDYLRELEAGEGARVIEYRFRDKPHGWKRFEVRAMFENGTVYHRPHEEDAFMAGYLKNLYLRPACHACAYSTLPRVGDLTLGDFWGIGGVDASMDDDRGTTLLIVNTQVGKETADLVAPRCHSSSVAMTAAVAGNSCLVKPVAPSSRRREFFNSRDKGGFESRTRAILRRDHGFWARIQRKAVRARTRTAQAVSAVLRPKRSS
jgi:coenzyme F420-reducing hydrogenase beta subunit